MDDRTLVARVLQGDTRLFEIIIKNTEGLVAQIVFKMIAGPEDRRDIAQDIYLKVYDKLPGFRFQSKLSTWIARIAYNTCINYRQKKKPVRVTSICPDVEIQEDALEQVSIGDNLASGYDTESIVYSSELSGILESVIETLPPVYKTLITLYHYEELSYGEIAEITDLPVGTVKNYLYRARKELKKNLMSQYNKEEIR